MSWQKVLDSHPAGTGSDRPDFWEDFLAKNPDVLHRLLRDVYTATYGTERPPTLDDLWEVMAAPKFATEDFGPAVLDLLEQRGHSIRWLAGQVGVVHPQLWRMINGQRPIINIHDTKGSMSRLEAVAAALKVHPSYFVEWRRLWIISLIDAAFATQPSLSVGVFRRFAGFEKPGNGRSDG